MSIRHVLAIAIVLASAAGCGSGAYEAKFEKRLAELGHVGPFTTLGEPLKLTGTNISIRVPKAMLHGGKQLDRNTQEDNVKVDQRRLEPSFYDVSGHRVTVEGIIQTRSLKSPWYCYVWVQNMKPGDDEKTVQAGILAHLKRTLPDAKFEWEDKVCKTPEKDAAGNIKTITWKRIAAKKVTQAYLHTYFEGGGEIKDDPVNFELWLLPEKDYYVIVAWTLPELIEGELKDFSRLAELTAGTIKTEAVADAAPPKEGERANKAG